MTFSKLLGTSVLVGALYGIAIFLLIYAFRDAFGAAAELGSPTISGRANSLVLVPGIAVGWGISMLCARVSAVEGPWLFLPLLLFVTAALATTLGLEWNFARESFQTLVAPAVLAVVIAAGTASVHQWKNA